jgi:transposase-like protein
VTRPKKRTRQYNRYSVQLKRKIAKEYLSGSASYGILAEEHGLKNKDVVKEFVKWYKRQNPELEKMDLEKEKSDQDPDQAARIKKLEAALRLSELKVEMLETMIDQAEQILSIEIRKKSGTNQSKK